MSFPWTDESEARLKQLREQCLTGCEIADTLSAEFGCECSRNAVMGKLRRLGLGTLSGVPNQHRPQSKPQRKPGLLSSSVARGYRPGRQLPALREDSVVTAIDAAPAESFRCTITDLTDKTCRWPIGDPWKPNFRFCGVPEADLAGKRPYCPCHQRMAWARA